MTFIQLDLTSLASVKENVKKDFAHDRLDILINCAGIMAQPGALSKDGYEIQFATNHLGHAMLTDCLLPTMLRTAQHPDADVRVVTVSSEGYQFHPPCGISFDELNSGSKMPRMILGGWTRYGQSKLANVLFAIELGRRYPELTSVVVHPGVVKTALNTQQPWYNRYFVNFTTWVGRIPHLEPEQGCWNPVWCAAAARKGELVSGRYYTPIGAETTLKKKGLDGELAKKLWEWTEGVLAKF
jgi:NAD(P)-dependent dehydrogenase (short-subunit alcohol dehydrogenase family)